MRHRKRREDFLRLGRQRQGNAPLVFLVGNPGHEPRLHQPVDQLDRTIVAYQQMLGEVAH